MPQYDVTIDGVKYRVNSQKALSQREAYDIAARQAQNSTRAVESTRQQRREAENERGKSRTWGQWASSAGRAALAGAADLGELGMTAVGALQGRGLSDAIMRHVDPRQQAAMEQRRPEAQIRRGTEHVANALNLERPVGDNERLMNAGVRGVVGSLIPGGGLAATAVNAGSGAAAGMAGEALRQRDFSPGVQMVGSVLAGVGPTALLSAGKNIGGTAARHFGREGAEEMASRAIQEGAEDIPTAATNITNRMAENFDSPGISSASPTMAELAGDTGLSGMQRSVARRTPGIGERMDANAQARGRAVQEAIGEVGDPEAVARLALNEGNRASQRIGNATRQVGPVADLGTSGAEASTKFGRRYAAAARQSGRAYGNVDEITPLQFDNTLFDDVRAVMTKYYGQANGRISPRAREVLGDMADEIDNFEGGFTANTGVMTNLDKRLADVAGAAKVQGRATTDSAFAEQLRRTLARHVERAAPQSYIDDLAAAKGVRRRQGQVFEQSRIGSTMGKDRYGNALNPDAEIPGALVVPGAKGANAAQELQAALGPNASLQTARTSLRRLIDSGKITNAEQLGNFDEFVNQFPSLRRDVDQWARAIKASDDLADTPLMRTLGKDKDAQEHIRAMLNSPGSDTFKELVRQVNASRNPSAVEGLRRALSNYIDDAGTGGRATRMDQAAEAIPDSAATRQAIARVLDRGSEALTPEQQEVLITIERELADVKFATQSGGTPRVPEVDVNAPFTSGWTRNTLRAIWKHLGNQTQVDDLVKKAILDPKFAVDMLRRSNPDRVSRFRRALGISAASSAAAGYNQATNGIPVEGQ